MRRLQAFAIILVIALAGCATGASFPVPNANAAAQADEPSVSPSLLSKAVADFTASKARAQAFADAQTNLDIKKLATDRVLCYDTILTHLNGISAATPQSEAAGFFDAQEKALQFHDVLLTSSDVVPLDVRVNCASTAAQITAATTTFFAKIINAVTVVGALH